MAKKPIDELGRTTLPWAEYRVKAGKIWNNIPFGEPKQAIVEEALGKGYWPDKEGNMVEWNLKSNKDRIENFQRQPVKTRKANAEQFTKNRKLNEQFTDITSEEAAKDWKKKNITDWNNKNNPTGKKLVKGTEDYNKYFRRYEHRIKVSDPFWKGNTGLDYLSGDPENLTWTTKSQWDLKDAGEMKHGKNYIFDVDQFTGDVTYTPRKGFKPHEAIFDTFGGKIDHTSKLIPTPKINRAKLIKLGIAGVVLPAAGSVANTLEASERAKIAAETNNRLDVFQSWLSNAELITGLIPAGEIISTPLGIANLGIDLARYDTQPTDTSSRQRFRHGER